MDKDILRTIDGTLGAGYRWFLRNFVFHPYFWLRYKVTVVGEEIAMQYTEGGALILPNHNSEDDGPLLLSLAWPHARLRPTVWHEFYDKFYVVMKPVGAVSMGSPSHLSEEERARRRSASKAAIHKLLQAKRGVVIFPEGGLNRDAGPIKINPKLTGAYDAHRENPDIPVLFPYIDGLGASARTNRWFWRPVTITISRLEGLDTSSVEVFSADLERRMNAQREKSLSARA